MKYYGVVGRKFLAILVIACLGCARGPSVSGPQASGTGSGISQANLREREMGRQIHQAIVSSFRVYTEPRLVGYVKRIGRSIARRAERRDLDYQFTVLYDERAYATSAPGGFVYATTGILNFLQNEAELAGILAYEVATLQFLDPRFSTSRKALGALAQTGALVGPFFGHIGFLAMTAIVLLHAFAESTGLSPEKRMEHSDRKALHYLVESGHDPQGYLDFLSRLQEPEPEGSPYFYDYLSSHPVTLARRQRAIAEFEKLPLEGKSFDVKRERYLEMTKGAREIYR